MLATSESWGSARYSRQTSLPELGLEGQQRLSEARILIVGAGGLGSPAALYLAAAGVGTLGLVDADRVALSNLQRQILYGEDDLGELKVERAQSRLQALNSQLRVQAIPEHFQRHNALEILRDYDLVIDACDNLSTRYLLADASYLSQTPMVYGSVYRFEGQVAVFPPDGPCYRCLYPQAAAPLTVPSCTEAGVLGVAPGLVGVLQATEALRLILEWGPGLSAEVLNIDLKQMRFDRLRLPQNPDCALCGPQPSITDIADRAADINAPTPETLELDMQTWKERVGGAACQYLDVREAHERARSPLNLQLLSPAPFREHHIPLKQLPGAANALSATEPLLVYCASGQRSAQAVQWLRQHGWQDSWSLKGGQAGGQISGPADQNIHQPVFEHSIAEEQ